MIDAVDAVLAQREALDRGFTRSLVLSVGGHLLIAGAALAAPFLLPAKPLLRVVHGYMVAVPPGGGGIPEAPAARPAPPQPGPPAAPPTAKPPEPPPQVLKPRKDTAPPRKGVPPLDAKRKTPQPAGGGGAGTSSQVPGLELQLPPGAGAPGGTDYYGDWYLASVQRKIWAIWNQQIRTGPQLSVWVSFTILADGSVEDVGVVQGSGVYLLDQAAQRAIYSAAPFGPLPNHYGTKRYAIRAHFKPAS